MLGRIPELKMREDGEEVLKDRHAYAFDVQQGNDVRIESGVCREHWINRLRAGQIRIILEVKVPRESNVDFQIGRGRFRIADLGGNVLETSRVGNVELDTVRGVAELTSGGASVQVYDSDTERLSIDSRAGNLTLMGTRGTLNASTGAGDIYLGIIDEADSRLRTGAGSIAASLNEGLDFSGKVKSFAPGAGEFEGNQAEGELPGKIEEGLTSKFFSGRVNGGGGDVELRARSVSVRVVTKQ